MKVADLRTIARAGQFHTLQSVEQLSLLVAIAIFGFPSRAALNVRCTTTAAREPR
ncbi:MAG TPA: hypothetical protein VEL06_12550 [Haliangiales bacterium]|nr:hypothetical protein [Haliangiales bacterium]